MSPSDRQLLETERHYGSMMKEIEAIDPNMLYSVVPGRQLHRAIHTPVTEGIEEA